MRNKFYIFLFIIVCCFAISVKAQSISLENIPNLKVEQISDNDLLLFQKKLQSSGLSVENALQILYQRGMKATEIEKLRKRLGGMGNTNQQRAFSKPDSISFTRKELIIEPESFVNIQSEIYGASYFNNPKLSFEPNLTMIASVR